MGPPGSLPRLPNWSEKGPSLNESLRTYAVTVPLNTTVNSGPLAVISKLFHFPPVL